MEGAVSAVVRINYRCDKGSADTIAGPLHETDVLKDDRGYNLGLCVRFFKRYVHIDQNGQGGTVAGDLNCEGCWRGETICGQC